MSAEARDTGGRWTSGSQGPLDQGRISRDLAMLPPKRTVALSMKQVRETEDSRSAVSMISHLAHHDPQ